MIYTILFHDTVTCNKNTFRYNQIDEDTLNLLLCQRQYKQHNMLNSVFFYARAQRRKMTIHYAVYLVKENC